MQETIELRVLEEHAALVFAESEGARLSDMVRKVVLDTTDRRWPTICEFQRNLRARRDMLFAGWQIRRRYTPNEIAGARLFRLLIKRTFEPAGEECGTQYDNSIACRLCHSGGRQVGPLLLPVARIPRKVDFTKTIASEYIVSAKAVNCLSDHFVSGVRFGPILSRGKESDGWRQLLVEQDDIDVLPPTRVGIDPCDDDIEGTYRCQNGDRIGLNLLSEIFVGQDALARIGAKNSAAIVASRQFVGLRSGLLRPERLLLATPKIYELVKKYDLRGLDFEIVNIV